MTTDTAPDISTSVVRITSSDPTNRCFGTGFVVASRGASCTIVTCTHVLRDVGGAAAVCVDGMPATVVIVDDDNTDLTVLRVDGLGDRLPLPLCATGQTGAAIRMYGYERFGESVRGGPLDGTLDRESWLESERTSARIRSWDLRIEGNYQLAPGYSGSPVIATSSQHVIGIVRYRVGRGDSGLAVSIAALPDIWPECPPLVPDEASMTSPTITIEIITHQKSPQPLSPNYPPFNWSAQLEQPQPEAFWNDTILPAFLQLREQVGKQGFQRINVQGNIHLSAALALGYVFQRAAQIEVCAYYSWKKEWWCSGTLPAVDHGLQVQQVRGPEQASDITLELGLTHNVPAYIDRWLEERGFPVYTRIQITPVSGPGDSFVRDSSHAVAIARLVRETLRTVRPEAPQAPIHLFVSTPQALAVLLGMQLSRLGSIQCYEYVAGRYQPSCLLR